jgi:transmembrane sensor
MLSKPEFLRHLFRKYLNSSLTLEEYLEFWSIPDEDIDEKILSEELRKAWGNAAREQTALPDESWDLKMEHLLSEVNRFEAPVTPAKIKSIPRIRIRWAAAAIFFVLLTGIAYWRMGHSVKRDLATTTSNQKKQNEQVRPGSSKATLTFGNGTKVALDSNFNQNLAGSGQGEMIKLAKGKLVYTSSQSASDISEYNTVATPRGGEYEVVLNDGTAVWLNAASSLRFPTHFSGNERVVYLTGEAYFEVAKDQNKAFRVVVNNRMNVEVLGTHFDINAYSDEGAVRTTLLQGSVRVNDGETHKLLRPGQQSALLTDGQIDLVDGIDSGAVIAWKNKMFKFKNDDLQSIMRQISRWYDVDVVLSDVDRSKTYSGTIRRAAQLTEVLQMLQLAGVNYSLDGKQLRIVGN